MKRKFSLPTAPQAAGELPFAPEKPWLAPLAGYSDLPFRLLCRELGAQACETEMISAKGLIYRSPGTDSLLCSSPADQPLVVQLFGCDPEIIAEAVLILRRLGYNRFDFNMGCPVRKVLRQKSGAALLEDIGLALKIARALLAAVHAKGEDLPEQAGMAGFKFRLDSSKTTAFVRDFGRRLEDLGADWLCLHPRAASDGYGGAARWEAIAALVETVNLPVIASGDLFTAQAAAQCLKQTGATSVMYARGSLKNPYIFVQHGFALAGERQPELDSEGLTRLIERHIAIARDYCGDRRAFGKVRSIIPRYVRHLPGVGELRQKLSVCQDWETLAEALERFMEAKCR